MSWIADGLLLVEALLFEKLSSGSRMTARMRIRHEGLIAADVLTDATAQEDERLNAYYAAGYLHRDTAATARSARFVP